MNERRIGFQIKCLSNMIKRKIDYLYKDTDMTGFQGYLMGFLIHEGEKRDIFQKDVEKELKITKASVTSVLQLLEKNGLIRRESVGHDARLKKIIVTQKGYDSEKMGIDILTRVDELVTRGITEEEMEIFETILCKMMKNLSDGTEENCEACAKKENE